MAADAPVLSIGQLAARTGLAVSAIRFYETRKLIRPERSPGGQRRYRRSDIRRLSFVMAAQAFGFTIQQIETELAKLPEGRTPTKRDWTRISRDFRQSLDRRIAALTQLRERLDGCIGCGCLSLKSCQIYNAGDHANARAAGPRFILGDRDDQNGRGQ